MAEMAATGKMAKGTRGQIRGKKAGTSKGRGRGKGSSSGGVKKTPPEEKSETLESIRVDKNLANAGEGCGGYALSARIAPAGGLRLRHASGSRGQRAGFPAA